MSCTVVCTAKQDGNQATLSTSFLTDDLARFVEAMKRMHEPAYAVSEAVLWARQGEVVLSLRLEALGQIRGKFIFTGKDSTGISVRLYGLLEMDQSYLPELCRQVESLKDFDYES